MPDKVVVDCGPAPDELAFSRPPEPPPFEHAHSVSDSNGDDVECDAECFRAQAAYFEERAVWVDTDALWRESFADWKANRTRVEPLTEGEISEAAALSKAWEDREFTRAADAAFAAARLEELVGSDAADHLLRMMGWRR